MKTIVIPELNTDKDANLLIDELVDNINYQFGSYNNVWSFENKSHIKFESVLKSVKNADPDYIIHLTKTPKFVNAFIEHNISIDLNYIQPVDSGGVQFDVSVKKLNKYTLVNNGCINTFKEIDRELKSWFRKTINKIINY